MNNINLRAVSDADAQFLAFIMNTDTVLNALNEIPTQLEDWADAIREWSKDNDEEDYIISDDEGPIGWLGINSLESADKVAYLKLAAILPEYHPGSRKSSAGPPTSLSNSVSLIIWQLPSNLASSST